MNYLRLRENRTSQRAILAWEVLLFRRYVSISDEKAVELLKKRLAKVMAGRRICSHYYILMVKVEQIIQKPHTHKSGNKGRHMQFWLAVFLRWA